MELGHKKEIKVKSALMQQFQKSKYPLLCNWLFLKAFNHTCHQRNKYYPLKSTRVTFLHDSHAALLTSG